MLTSAFRLRQRGLQSPTFVLLEFSSSTTTAITGRNAILRRSPTSRKRNDVTHDLKRFLQTIGTPPIKEFQDREPINQRQCCFDLQHFGAFHLRFHTINLSNDEQIV